MIQYTPSYTQFLGSFDGTTLIPGQPGYEEAKEVINAVHSALNPAIIVRPHSALGVAQALQFAQDTQLKVAVRSAGHNPAGFGTIQGGLVLDLRGVR